MLQQPLEASTEVNWRKTGKRILGSFNKQDERNKWSEFNSGNDNGEEGIDMGYKEI